MCVYQCVEILCEQMLEDAVHFLSKETVVQAIARSATKVRMSKLNLQKEGSHIARILVCFAELWAFMMFFVPC